MLNEKKGSGSYQKTVALIQFLRTHGVRQDLLANLVHLIILEKKQSKEIDKLERYHNSLISAPSKSGIRLDDQTTQIDAYITETIRPLSLDKKKQLVMQINQLLLNKPDFH